MVLVQPSQLKAEPPDLLAELVSPAQVSLGEWSRVLLVSTQRKPPAHMPRSSSKTTRVCVCGWCKASNELLRSLTRHSTCDSVVEGALCPVLTTHVCTS